MRARAAPVPTPQRLARWRTFMWLWLLRYAAFLVFAQNSERWLLKARRTVRDLILIRAAALMPSRPQRRRYRRAPPPGFAYVGARRPSLRAAAGSALRARLRARTPGQALAALFSALQDLDMLARAIVKRLPRGLTRLCPIVLTRAPADALARPAPLSAHADDTS